MTTLDIIKYLRWIIKKIFEILKNAGKNNKILTFSNENFKSRNKLINIQLLLSLYSIRYIRIYEIHYVNTMTFIWDI